MIVIWLPLDLLFIARISPFASLAWLLAILFNNEKHFNLFTYFVIAVWSSHSTITKKYVAANQKERMRKQKAKK